MDNWVADRMTSGRWESGSLTGLEQSISSFSILGVLTMIWMLSVDNELEWRFFFLIVDACFFNGVLEEQEEEEGDPDAEDSTSMKWN